VRATWAVAAAGIVAVVATLAGGVAFAASSLDQDAERLEVSMLRFRYLLFSTSALGPGLALLVLLVAGAALALRHPVLAPVTFALAMTLGLALVLGAIDIATLSYVPAGVRVGEAVKLLAALPIALAAAWVARSAEPVPDPPREAPD
jgi:hypothetical protein